MERDADTAEPRGRDRGAAPAPGCGLSLQALLLLLAAVGGALLFYGATARDTIGGLNALATLLALATGALGVLLAAFGRVRRHLGTPALLLALLLHLGLIAGAVAVLMTREFHAGYGP